MGGFTSPVDWVLGLLFLCCRICLSAGLYTVLGRTQRSKDPEYSKLQGDESGGRGIMFIVGAEWYNRFFWCVFRDSSSWAVEGWGVVQPLSKGETLIRQYGLFGEPPFRSEGRLREFKQSRKDLCYANGMGLTIWWVEQAGLFRRAFCLCFV